MVDIPHYFWFCLAMSSLKTFLYDMSGRLRMSPASLYERQRELVRHGLLPVREGRGPGSGVPLTAETVATFLIGLLATDSLIDLAEHTAELCAAKPSILYPQQETERTFHSDLADALTEASAARYTGVSVTRHWRGALILDRPTEFEKNGSKANHEGFASVEYLVSEQARRDASVFSHTVSLENEPFWLICIQLRQRLRRLEPPSPASGELAGGANE